jgi:hypothetical protein
MGPVTGRRVRLRTAVLAGLVLVAFGAWWWQAAWPDPAGTAAPNPAGTTAPDPATDGRTPAAPGTTADELRRWGAVIDGLLPSGQDMVDWSQRRLAPDVDLVPLSDQPVAAGRYLLELACVGRGEARLRLAAGTGTGQRLSIRCTAAGELRRFHDIRLRDRFTLHLSTSPGAEGYLGHRLTAHQTIATAWRGRAETLLPVPATGAFASGGGPVRAGHPLQWVEPVGAGPRRLSVVCVGRGSVLVAASRDPAAPPPPAVQVRCAELPLAQSAEWLLVPGGPVRITVTPNDTTIAWLRHRVTRA